MTNRGKTKRPGNEKGIVQSLDKRDPTTDRSIDLAVFDNWNLLADFSLTDQADCQLQNETTWIRIRPEVSR